jgi:cytochrome c biogenesis protein CcmG/thiol:disulfide interchange protein DsbE
MKPLRVAAVAVVLALLGLLVWDFAHQSGSGVAKSVDDGKAVAAPKLDLPRLGSTERLELASYRGKVVVVNFWASWCVDCKLEAKTFENAVKRWEPKGVVFLGVDSQDGSGPAQRYAAKYHMTYPLVHDGEGTEGSQHWGVTGYPETFVVDRQGRILPHAHWATPIVGSQLVGEFQSAIRRALAS